MATIASTPVYATDATYGGPDTCIYNDTVVTAGFAATAQNTVLYIPTDGWSSGTATGMKIRWYRASDNSFAGESDYVVADGTGTVTKALNATFAVANGENFYPLMVSDAFVKLVTDGANTFQTFNPTGTYASPPATINPATDPGSARAKFRVALDGTASGSNTNIQPSVGSAAFTGYAPTVTTTGAQTRQPSAGAMALAGIASTLTLTLPAPDSGSMSFTGYTPTVTTTNSQNIRPPVGSMSFTGYAPTVTNTSSRNMTPLTGTLTFVGYAPTVTIYIPTRQPTAGAMAFTGYAPSVSINSPNSGASQQRNRRKRGMLNMIWGR